MLEPRIIAAGTSSTHPQVRGGHTCNLAPHGRWL